MSLDLLKTRKQKPRINDEENCFYKRLADVLGVEALSPQESDTAYKVRQQAIRALDKGESQLSPYTSPLMLEAWYLTISDYTPAKSNLVN